MFPNLPSTSLHAQADRDKPVPANDHEYAQKHGRVLHFRSSQVGPPSRTRLVLVAALVIITLAVLAAFL